MTYKLEDILSVLSESTLDDFFNEYDFFTEDKKEFKEKAVNAVKKAEDGTVNLVDKAAHSKAGKKVIKTVDDMKNRPKNEKVEKVIDTVKTKGKEVASKVANSKVAETSGNAINTAINKTSGAVGKVVAGKRPTDNSPEVQATYENKVNVGRAAFKGGIVALSKAVLAGPLDWLLTASVVKGIAQSDDPSDKMIADTYKKVSTRVKALKERLDDVIDHARNEGTNIDDVKKQYDAITLQGLNYAKEIDAVKIRAQKEQPVKESADMTYTFDKYLIKEDGILVDNAYEMLSTIIEKVDYEKYDIYHVIESYIDMLI